MTNPLGGEDKTSPSEDISPYDALGLSQILFFCNLFFKKDRNFWKVFFLVYINF